MSELFKSRSSIDSKKTPIPLFANELEDTDEIDFRHYLRVINRSKWGIIGVAFIAAIYGAFSAYTAQPLYKAEVKMLITPNQPNVVSIDPVINSTNIWLFYETQYEIIRSRSVAMAVVKKLKLDKAWSSENEKKEPGLLHDLKKWLFGFSFQDEKKTVLSREERFENLAGMIQGGLTATGVEDSQIVLVSYVDTNPEQAARIANAIADAYMVVGLESRLEVAKKAVSWLTERMGDLRKKLAISETQLQEFQAKEGIVDTESQQRIVERKLATITDKLVRAQTDRLDAETRYRQVQKAKAERKSLESLTPVLKHPLIQRLKEENSKLSRRVAELNERYGKKHPKMIAARLDMKEARTRLDEEVSKIVEGVRREYEIAVENERRLLKLDKEMKSGIRDLKGKEFQLVKLEREVATNRQLYETFLSRFKETDISGNSSFSNVRIIDHALPPTAPFWPRKKRIILLWLLGGLFVGVAISFAKEGFTNTFRSVADVERETGIPGIGSVPIVDKGKLGSYLGDRKFLDNSVDPFFESIRNIRTGIILSDIDNPPKIIMITSAAPDDGKTSLSCELAMSFSQLGRTLLLDADLRKPSIAKIMNLDQNPGLTDMMASDVSINEVVKNDEKHENLHFVTSGSKASNALEILSSKKFDNAIRVFRNAFDYIVIDTPPSLLFSDALVIGSLVDCAVLVIRADKTTIPMVSDTLKRFQVSNIDILGAVLSHIDTRFMDARYGSYSYYGDYFRQAD